MLLASNASRPPVDVAVIGGGLSGTLAAILLERIGLHVALIDPRPVYPPDFRAEQLVGLQVAVLHRLGLFDILVGDLLPAECAVTMQAGRTIGFDTTPHYGIHYDTMVNRARQHVLPSVQMIEAQVVDINLTESDQQIGLSDGSRVTSRLVILATGLGQRLLRQLNISKTMIRDQHSLTFGFDVEVGAPARFRSSVLVAYGEQAKDRVDYLTMFSIENTIRANLFTYHNHRDIWTKGCVKQPRETLLRVIEGVEQVVGGFQVSGPVQLRVNDLTVAANYRRDGLVLIGDAFQTSCPAAGTGIGRLLNDIDRLCNYHVPMWFKTQGMQLAKINQFYDDPAKRYCDAEALRVAAYRRAVTTETSLRWKVHRQRVALQRTVRLAVRRPPDNQQAAWDQASMAPHPLPQMPTIVQVG